MESNSEWREFVDKAKNFHWNADLIKKQIVGNEIFYRALYTLKNDIINELNEKEELSEKQILENVFLKIFDFAISQDETYSIFTEETDSHAQAVKVHDNVYKACLFTALCTFLHDSVRIDGKSLRKFIYDNSPEYDDRVEKDYYLFAKSNKWDFEHLKDNEKTFRKMRNRLLSSRPVNNKRPEWAAMAKDSEYEWAFYYALQDLDESLQDTYKRIGNLYNGINKVLNSDQDEGYESRLESEYKKFASKLEKLKYENYLELQKNILEYICKNEDYYGMDIYRFEKKLKFYTLTYEVKCLLECENENEEKEMLVKSIILKDIHYPKVYKDFASLSNLLHIQIYTHMFNIFLNLITGSFYFVMDELVEKGYLGDNWEAIFLDMINKMAESVFYNPKKIDYSTVPESQEKFMKILDAPVRVLLGLPI